MKKNKIEAFIKMIETEAGKTVVMPDGKEKAIEELDSVKGAMRYIMVRDQLLRSIKSQYGQNATLYRAEATQQRQYLSVLAKQIMMQHPDFYYIWYDIFRKEIEEQTTFGVYG